MRRHIALILVLGLVVFTGACGSKQEASAPDPAPAPAPAPEVVEEVVALATAVAVLQPRADSEVSGMVAFVETSDGVEVVADIARVAPGMHGLHLHEFGDCSSDDFKSTGGHFNPTDAPHGAPTDEMRHAGDFGNIDVGADGSGHLELLTDMLTVEPSAETTVIGRAVILHEGEDDLESQPTGAAGARLAFGIVVMEGLEEVPGMVEMEEEEVPGNPEAVD